MSVATAGTAGMDAPPLLVNGASCTEDSRCVSGHCDGVCCDKGVQCCRETTDCKAQPDGMGKACGDRANCRGTAGKIVCMDSKCVTMNGVRDDSACSNTIEANECGLYPSVFCLGGEMQSGAPPCPMTCATEADCDPDAHCDAGKCVADLPNGEPCKRPEDCAQRNCKNIRNGVGICCSGLADCCKVATDCPDTFRVAPSCTNTNMCEGEEIVAQCNGNTCNSMQIRNDAACNGKAGPKCDLYKDIVCMAGRTNTCKLSCANMGDCDANAYCDAGKCALKKENGQSCANGNQCASGNCGNGVCCGANQECCTRPDQCTRNLDLKCDNSPPCQGSKRSAMCQGSACVYSPNNMRVPDDSACTASSPGSDCGPYKNLVCNGRPEQGACANSCTGNADCDSNAYCASDGMCTAGTPPSSGTPGGQSD